MNNIFESLEAKIGKHASTVLSSNLLFTLLAIGLLVLSHKIHDTALARMYNYLVVLLGALCGWGLGIFFTPYNKAEADKFLTIGQAISAFLSGYALSKFDRFLEASLFHDGKIPYIDAWIRIGLFICSVTLFALLIFTNRAYFRNYAEQEKV